MSDNARNPPFRLGWVMGVHFANMILPESRFRDFCTKKTSARHLGVITPSGFSFVKQANERIAGNSRSGPSHEVAFFVLNFCRSSEK